MPARHRATLLVTFFSQGAMFASWAAHIPVIKAQLGVSDATLGTVLLAPPVGAAVAMLITGRLLSRFGSRRVIRPSMLGYCVAAVSVGESRSAWVLGATLAAWGACGGSLDVSTNTQAVAVERAQGRHLLPLLHGSWSVGALTGAGVGTAAVALRIPLTPQMLAMAIPALLITLVLGSELLDDAAGHAVTRTGIRMQWRTRVPRAALFLGTIALATMLCEGAVLDWSAIYIRGLGHGAAGISGLGYAAFAVTMAAVRLTGARLLDQFPARLLLSVLATLAAVAMAFALATGVVATAIAGFACLGAGTGLVMPTVLTAAGRVSGLTSGAAITGVSACGWIGYMGGPPMIGHLAQLSSMRAALLIIPVLTLIIAVALARVAHPSRVGVAA